jgi:LytS/YehU family sensor histidine kinase
VASLIPADPLKAEKVVVKLSAIYQGVLEATRKTGHSLERELQFCRDYLDIEQVRFGERLSAKVETENGLNPSRVMVPVFILQPLVENAIKHGISSRATGGCLWIKAGVKNGSLTIGVEDDGVGFGNSPYAGTGTALENCRKRLELGFGKEGRLEILPREGGGTRVRLTLPVVSADPAAQEGT